MGFLDFVSDLFGGLDSLLADLVRFVVAFVNVVIQVVVFIWNALLVVLTYVLNGLRSIAAFFKHLWEGFFKNLVTGLARALRAVHDFLEKHLRPVINFLRRVRALVDRIYRQYIRPYLQFLQRIRRWLAILRVLHIRFAETLDRRLAQTEAAIAHEFLLVRGVLNDVINFVNAVADPRRLSRMVLVSIAGRRTAAAVIRAVTGLPIGFFFPHTGKGALPFEKPVTSSGQLRNPALNPSPSAILGGLLPLPVDGFEEVDPTPGNAELDGLETVPYFGELGDSLLASDLALDAIELIPVSLLDAIEHRTGPLAEAAAPTVATATT